MTETLVQTQVRLVLEQQCAELFMSVLASEHRESGRQVSLFCFDYGDQGNLAYKTSLKLPALADTLERLLASPWATGGQRFVNARHAISAPELATLGHGVEALCPAGVGFALLIGEGDSVQYFATGDRAGCAEIFRKLVEFWKVELTGERRAEN